MLEKRWGWIVAALLVVQCLQTILVVHRESLTFDEANHMYAGYMMGHAGDYGLNPEHPPLVKLLSALPLFGHDYWLPEQKGRNFKVEAYLGGRDWLARNDGASQRMVFKMRLMAGLLAIGLSLMVFLSARAWFGTTAGLAALVLVSFDPNVLAHSALVTTDIAVSLFFLAAIYGFYRYAQNPSWGRLATAGCAAGLLLASKHSGILLAPMLVALILWETVLGERGSRGKIALRLCGALAAIVVIGVVVLWAFYGFRYAARPDGMVMNPSLADAAANLTPLNQSVILAIAHWHLLPESYLMGLVDVKNMAQFYPTFVLGKVYAHGVWWYFPVAFLIKTTLGLLGLLAVTAFAVVTKRFPKGREIAYLVLPAAVYMAAAVAAGMDIGARHILPVYVLLFVLAGGGVAALANRSRRWSVACGVLLAAHVVSALIVFPNYMTYANGMWGGARNTHDLLSDANVDWAQQLYQVKAWQDRHKGEDCWFAYFAYPEINPETYGITCHHMPNIDTFWMGGADAPPAVLDGNVLISAGDLSGCEWPSSGMNPYAEFQKMTPAETIDDAVFVYHGQFDAKRAAALARAENAFQALWKGDAQGAYALAKDAVGVDPMDLLSQSALGDSAAALGKKDEAHVAWEAARARAKTLEPDAQVSYVPDLEAKLAKQ